MKTLKMSSIVKMRLRRARRCSFDGIRQSRQVERSIFCLRDHEQTVKRGKERKGMAKVWLGVMHSGEAELWVCSLCKMRSAPVKGGLDGYGASAGGRTLRLNSCTRQIFSTVKLSTTPLPSPFCSMLHPSLSLPDSRHTNLTGTRRDYYSLFPDIFLRAAPP
jgi:hypothetical protein